MIARRPRLWAGLGLVAYFVLGSSLVVASLYRSEDESIHDLTRADLADAATAHADLRLADAEGLYRHVLAEIRGATGGDRDYDREQSMVLVRLGHVLEDQGRYGDAERCYKDALRLSERDGNPYGEAPIGSLVRLKEVYEACNDVRGAEECRTGIDSIATRVEPIYLRSIALQRGLARPDSARLAEDLITLGNLYYQRGEPERAAPLFAEAFAIRSAAQGRDSWETLAALIRLGIAEADAGEDGRAAAVLRETLVTRESELGPDAPRLVVNLYNLGMLAHRNDRFAEADSLFRRALAIEERVLGSGHPYTMTVLTALADCRMDMGDFAGARAYQSRVVEIRERVFGRDSRMVGAGLLALVEIESTAGDRARAREVCAEALQVLSKATDEFDPLVIECESVMWRLSRYVPGEA